MGEFNIASHGKMGKTHEVSSTCDIETCKILSGVLNLVSLNVNLPGQIDTMPPEMSIPFLFCPSGAPFRHGSWYCRFTERWKINSV